MYVLISKGIARNQTSESEGKKSRILVFMPSIHITFFYYAFFSIKDFAIFSSIQEII